MKVFLNPGHAPDGRPDPGAVGPGGLRECDVVWQVGKQAADFLRAAYCEVQVLQHDDLGSICAAANSWQADCLVSLHCNAFTSPQAQGMEVWISPGQKASGQLANLIMRQMQGEFPQLAVRADKEFYKEAGFYVLNASRMPAVLVELAFITNPAEAALLGSQAGQKRFAAAIARGVTDWGQVR